MAWQWTRLARGLLARLRRPAAAVDGRVEIPPIPQPPPPAPRMPDHDPRHAIEIIDTYRHDAEPADRIYWDAPPPR